MGSAYLSENHQPQLYGANVSTFALAIISVCLRLAARKVFSKAGFWLDDYAILASLVVATGNFVNMIISGNLLAQILSPSYELKIILSGSSRTWQAHRAIWNDGYHELLPWPFRLGNSVHYKFVPDKIFHSVVLPAPIRHNEHASRRHDIGISRHWMGDRRGMTLSYIFRWLR